MSINSQRPSLLGMPLLFITPIYFFISVFLRIVSPKI